MNSSFNTIKGLPQAVAFMGQGNTNGHKTKTINGVEFYPYDTTKSRVKSYVVAKNGYYMGIADRGWTGGYQFGGQLDVTLNQIADSLKSTILGMPIEASTTFADLLDDSDCE